MKHYPDSISPPKSVFEARAERNRHVVQAVGWGISLRTIIIVCELIGVFVFGSVSLLMDALSSLVDVVSSLFLVLFIKLAQRPPDADHPFGHGRYEPLAGLQLGLLLTLVGGGMLVQQIWQLSEETSHGVIDSRAWLIPFGALILLEISYAITMRTAKKHESPALAADAIHYRIDSLTSLFATIALLVAAFLPQWSYIIDHLGAISIALLMIILGIIAGRKNLNQLLDRVPDSHYFEIVKKAARTVAGVRDTEKIRLQIYGPDAHVDIDIEVDPSLSVEAAHKISQHVRVAIQKEWPAVRDVTVHIEPFYPNDH